MKNIKHFYVQFILLILTATFFTLNVLQASQIDIKPNFHERYVLIKKIGRGTYSNVFLSQDLQGELFAIKKYEITDEFLIDLFKQNGICPNAYIKMLAAKEQQIGQLTDHPHIVKIREVWFEDSAAYVVMNYVEGKTLAYAEHFPLEMQVVLLQQFLSALEHLLTRNIIVDDLWSENFLISHDGTHLTLLDLGGNEVVNEDAEMSVGHYLAMIENMLFNISEEAAQVLDNCKPLLANISREEAISSEHVVVLINWVKAMQHELEKWQG